MVSCRFPWGGGGFDQLAFLYSLAGRRAPSYGNFSLSFTFGFCNSKLMCSISSQFVFVGFSKSNRRTNLQTIEQVSLCFVLAEATTDMMCEASSRKAAGACKHPGGCRRICASLQEHDHHRSLLCLFDAARDHRIQFGYPLMVMMMMTVMIMAMMMVMMVIVMMAMIMVMMVM